nr:hypothetical protein Iba_chr09aCG17030 [Ipomoea batatas]GMD33086.1 hypothetical protein Iba_chr09bCG14330 [Ipomoea batatas]GMD34626.1 hypothetical protein Iba_chr09cCG13880 [Ipomoea batatas]
MYLLQIFSLPFKVYLLNGKTELTCGVYLALKLFSYPIGVFQQILFVWIKISYLHLQGRSSYIPTRPWTSGNK